MQVVEVWSEVKPGLLLHRLVTWPPSDQSPGPFERHDFSDSRYRLQVAQLVLPQGQAFAPHLHIDCGDLIERGRAQEAWVILRGSVAFSYFDVDGSQLGRVELNAPAMTFTNAGGHAYEAMTDALVLEFKSGPYEGRERDKIGLRPA